MENMTEERFITMRVLKLAYIAAVTVLSGAVLGAVHKLHLGDILALVFVDALFAVLFVFYLESGRLHYSDKPDSAEDYERMCVYVTLGEIGLALISFCPDYTAPVLVMAFLLSAALHREQALVLSLFFDVQLTLCTQASVYVMACSLMLMFLGVMLTRMYERAEYRKFAEMSALALSIAVPVLFSYMEGGTPVPWFFMLCILSGAISVIGMHFLYDSLHHRLEHFGEISLDTIVDPSFHLVREIKKYSQVDYNHAIRVSKIAAHCAADIGADVKLAAVGGFYYRIGKLEGEPFIENGVKIAQNNCFPHLVIQILSEYYGEINPISMIESAVVHITDMLVTKFELMDKSTLSSSWNRDMIIYQTLNEQSSSGIYDQSGLSMNQFLKIREFLAKEEELL